MGVVLEMLANLFTKPFTILYPTEKVPVPPSFRGRVVISEEKCIGCSRCAQACPAQCITMIPNEREVEFKGKKMVRKKRPQVKIFRCIRCGLCERHCPTGAIALASELSETGTDREAVVT
jgi:formate hydrogenlyase subunit 6/NADH:ubiquinone oxidoreductase subunit I